MPQLYLEKGAEHNDINAIISLIRLWFMNNTKKLSVDFEKVIAWAEYAYTITNDIYVKALLAQCRA